MTFNIIVATDIIKGIGKILDLLSISLKNSFAMYFTKPIS